ncbi:MAG TPA: hypothetical protein VGB77_02495 [Abditibacteriaceae bacterium]|jgi:hypothetical protein
MAAVARKTQKKRITKKPAARTPAPVEVIKVASATSKTSGKAPLKKGRATATKSTKRAASKIAAKPSPAPESMAQETKARAKSKTAESVNTVTKAVKATTKTTAKTPTKAQQVFAFEATTPRSRAQSKANDVVIAPSRKTKRRKRKTAVKRKVEAAIDGSSRKPVTPPKAAPAQASRGKGTKLNQATGTVTKTVKSVAQGAAVVKARRVRAPKDLAAQYGEGEKPTSKRRATESSETKRARRDAALRQKMREAMEVGDDIIARLRRAGAIAGEAGSDESEMKNGHHAKRIAGSRVLRRPRKWEARCGKCGAKSLFKTPAGLCAKCGAIMVRE